MLLCVIEQEAAAAACKLLNILQMHKQSPEKAGMSHCGTPDIHHCFLNFTFYSLSSFSHCFWVRSRDGEIWEEFRVALWVRTGLHSTDFYWVEFVCFFPESAKTRSRWIWTYSRCEFMWNWCTDQQPKTSSHPKINCNIWELKNSQTRRQQPQIFQTMEKAACARTAS